jgi:hypothetical protein
MQERMHEHAISLWTSCTDACNYCHMLNYCRLSFRVILLTLVGVLVGCKVTWRRKMHDPTMYACVIATVSRHRPCAFAINGFGTDRPPGA